MNDEKSNPRPEDLTEPRLISTIRQGRLEFTMNNRILIVSLLLAAAIALSFPFVPSTFSQTSAATTTVNLEQPAAGGCTEHVIAFSAPAGKQVTGTFGSSGSINFYILTQNHLSAIKNCELPTTLTPLYGQQNSVGHDNPYRSLTIPANGTYYFVFLYHNPNSPATAILTYPTWITIVGGTVVLSSSTNPVLQSSTARSTSSSTGSTTALPATSVGTTSVSLVSSSSTSSSESSQGGSLATSGNFGTIGVVGVVAVIAIVGAVVAFTRRKKTQPRAVTVQEVPQAKGKAEPSKPTPEAPPQETALSTGYSDLDGLLVGGLPEGYAVLLLSPPCDERDLLLRKLISSALSSQIPTFYVSNDPNRIQDLVGRYWKDFYALSPQADKVLSPPANLYKISGFDNLSDFNISLTKTIEGRVKQRAANRLMIIDLLTDILLQHKALTSRKWLSDFIAKRKGEGFTVLAFLNPLVSPKEETQTLIDVFDGVIEIYERELRERARRFLVVKRMYGRKYSESELMLDKDKLF